VVQIAVVSPLPAVRAGLRALLGSAAGHRVIAESAQLELLDRPSGAVEVVVIDAADLDPEELVAFLEPGAPGEAGELNEPDRLPGIVLLGPITGDEQLPALLGDRAWAYLPRDTTAERLVAAIEAVVGGLVAVDPSLAGRLLARGAPGSSVSAAESGGEALTEREREVLQLVALGLPNKQIARRLGISEHTVKFHVAAILAKLGAASRTEAVHLGARRGLVTL
jgi:DNA-binding NarL/FixJ family response regulator